jgi:hypothetical protein
MTLQVLIHDELSNRDIHRIAQQLGYSSSSKLSKRIQLIVDSPFLGLDTGGFDFHYGTEEFITRLCAALSIPEILYKKVIAETKVLLEDRKQRFDPYIFIDTAFKRESQPIHILAALEPTRYINLDEGFLDLSLNDQLEEVQSLIRKHFSLNPHLLIWGDVKRYVFFYDEQTVLIVSSQGELIGAKKEYQVSRVTLKLK